jgi:hypothetical protein
MTRIRSPNYPAFSLPTAIERARAIHAVEGKNAATRETIAKHMGFGGLNGASASAISAITKYGLIEALGDGEVRLTDLAMRILYPHTDEERQKALQEAAFKPALFSEIHEKWPDRPPSDENLRSFLLRNGFSQGALDQVIQFYRETIDIASAAQTVHDSPPSHPGKEVHMSAPQSGAPAPREPFPSPAMSSKPFTVAFDGTVLSGTISLRTVRDIDRLIKVLTAQKAAIEAMQDYNNDAPSHDDPE